MTLYSIILSATDSAGVRPPFQTVYRLCKTEKEAMDMLKVMVEVTKKGVRVVNGYYVSPELSSDEKTLKLKHHDEIAQSHFVDWDETFSVSVINNVEELFKDLPF